MTFRSAVGRAVDAALGGKSAANSVSACAACDSLEFVEISKTAREFCKEPALGRQ